MLAKRTTQNSTTVSARTALEMATIRAAKAMGREADLGSLEVGKLADLVVLSKNPLTVPAAQIRSIQVRETIKAGRSIYRAAAQPK